MKNKSIVIIISLLVILFICTNINNEIPKKVSCGYNYGEKNSIMVENNNKCFKYTRIEKKSKNDLKRLMIVAHPDDETIFGGGHLLQEKYTVVCVTCGAVDYRVKEFEKVMKVTKDDYIMLGFTDRENKTGPISHWNNDYSLIYEAISNIINSENWDVVITHNPDGEYGHIHHIMTSEIVTDIVDKEKLYYFGHWYRNGSNESKIDNNLYNQKMDKLISVYNTSQGTALNYNYNMLPYENWIKSTEW